MLRSDCGENYASFPKSPIFRQSRRKGGGRTTIHFTASDDNVQLLLKMVISVNQLSLYGAAADLIKELPDDQRAPGNLLH